MSNLKDLKVRIGSVKSTQKITKAMKMVAASKLRRAREKAESAAPYAKKMECMLQTLASSVSNAKTAPALLQGNGKDQTHLLVVVTSDRGLCGGLNTNTLKLLRSHIHRLSKDQKIFKLLCVGKKGYDILRVSHEHNILDHYDGVTKQSVIPFEDADHIASDIIERFFDHQFDVCTVFYSQFKSTLIQSPIAQKIIPLDIKDSIEESSATNLKAVYEYEPNEQDILSSLLPKNIAVQLFHALLENTASEHGARMSAMDNATRNAGEMIKGLTRQYNKTRQAVITKELIEIISGAEAL